ncbi:MAG: hypothetical protein Fur0043_10100 [Anaerolineales bacterium]
MLFAPQDFDLMKYNHDMVRKIRLLLAILILALSCALLVWGIWPEERQTRIQPIQPTQMQLPTPASFMPGLWSACWILA